MQKQNLFKRAWNKITLAEDALVTTPDKKQIVYLHAAPIGSSGSKNFSGYPEEEYLQELRGRRRADVFDKMRRSDPTMAMVLNAVKYVIKQAKWDMEPGEDTDEAKQDAALVEHILFNDMDISWGQFIYEALGFCDFGFSVFEVVNKVVPSHPKFGPYIGIKKLAWRSQRTIERWNLDTETGALHSVTQMAFGDLDRNLDIPADFLMVFTIGKEGSNYEGISLQRPCYGNFFRKQVYQKLNAIGVEKFAIPTPTAEIPDVDANTQQFENLKTVLEQFVSHESQYITYPKGWVVNLVGNTYDPEKVEKSIDAEDRRMVGAFLANFLLLGGNSSGGSWALSTDQSDFFLSSLEHIAAIIKDEINRCLIPKIIKTNRGERSVYPKLKSSGISDKAGKELAEVIKLFVDSRTLTPDDPLEDHLRKQYNLPIKSSIGIRQPPAPSFAPQFAENNILKRIRLSEKARGMR